MTWAVTDRAHRVGLVLLVLVCVGAATPILLGSTSLPLMAITAISVVSMWRMSLARTVQVSLDADGITKTLGTRSWRLAWSEVEAVSFTRFLGSDQLLLTGEPQPHWSASDRLFSLVPAGTRAVQVPTTQLAAVGELLADHGLLSR
ncbi:hypothetical protein ATK74_1596 [Propionicimonas paludicola]|uniref:PH (Pleckstrin Homology) domain-containing protein n=1 Tax=Propionicimonas paludicola TaxID=185243 RepID=A0A2A9CU07_9ACTN|nr:hypothetical protein [Propionicimonas paludicola]PFG17039.1 hypothetical protein ATK74_1596 [Propionicimonas paludicola]